MYASVTHPKQLALARFLQVPLHLAPSLSLLHWLALCAENTVISQHQVWCNCVQRQTARHTQLCLGL